MGRDSQLNPTARQLASAAARVRDHLGRVLEIGDEVLIVSPAQLYRVASIRPVLDPGAPPNQMQVLLVTQLQLAIPRDSGVANLYVTRHQAEIKDSFDFQGEAGKADETPPA